MKCVFEWPARFNGFFMVFIGSTKGLQDSLGTRRGLQEPEVDTALMDTVCFRFFYGVLLILWFLETGPFANCL